MTDISATSAARGFARLLDSVEHDGESFTIMRHGVAVARIEPITDGNGAAVRDALQDWAPGPDLAKVVHEVRSLLILEDRR